MADIDELQIKIKADSAKASDSIDKLASSLDNLGKSLSFDTSKLSNIASGIRSMSDAATGFKGAKSKEITSLATALSKFSNVDTSSFYGISAAMKNLAAGMKDTKTIDTSGILNTAAALSKMGGTLATVGTSNLVKIKDDLAYFVKGMNSVGSLNFDTTGLTNLIGSISKLGGKISTQATANLPQISAQLQNFVRQMNKIGELKFDMTNMSSLVTSISRLGSVASGRAVNNIPLLANNLKYLFETLSKAPNVSANIIRMTEALANLAKTGASSGRAATSLGKSLNIFSGSANKAKSSSFSLAAAFGKLYASYWLLFRAFSKIKDAIDISSSLTEVENVVRTTFGNYEKLIQDFSKTSIQDFGMSELTAKQVASRFQAMGTAMGFSQGKMADMSLQLTKLTADMASFYDMEQSDVARNLQAVFTGETEPLRKYGLDLTQATLKEWAMKQGLDADISSMTQAEKTMFRYQYVMANTAAAQGDFARTSDTWANQIRILKQSFEQLAAIIGGALINAFKPFVRTLNAVMQKVIAFATTVTNALGSIFGWKFEISAGGLADDWSDAAGSAADIADSTGQAAKNVEKMNKGLRAFDELNLITTPDNSSGSGSGGSGGGGASGGGASGGLVQVDTIFKDYESQIRSLRELGAYISDALSDAMESIDWDRIYSKARNFGKGLADFLNGLIKPRLFSNIGKTIAGALNTALEFLDSFGERFDWKNFGNSIAAGINSFFKTFKFSLLAKTLNKWAKGLLDTMITALEKTRWDLIGKKIGEFLSDIDFASIGAKVARLLWDAINAGISIWSGMFSAAPIETTILSVISAIKISTKAISGLESLKAAIDSIKTGLEGIAALAVAHPIALITAAVGGLALALYNMERNWDKKIADEYSDWQKEIGSNVDGIKEASNSLRNLSETTQSLVTEADTSAEQLQKLASSYFELADKTSLTAGEQVILKQRASDLIDACPALQDMIDATTGRYTAQKNEMEKLINAQEEYYRVLAYEDVVKNYGSALASANVELEIANKNYRENADKLEKLNDIAANIDPYIDSNIWYEKNKESLSAYGIEAENGAQAQQMLIEQIGFLEKEQTNLKSAQQDLTEEMEKANSDYEIANSLLATHTLEYQNLSSALDSVDFGEVAINASKAIDDLGGVFVNGKQVVGEEAIQLYQTIIDAYGTTDQEMYNLGEKGVVQFGIGGKAGATEAVPTMTTELENQIISWYRDRGYQVALDGGSVVVLGFRDGGISQAPYAVNQIAGSISDNAKLKEKMMSDLGDGWAKNTSDGYNKGIENQKSTTGSYMLDYINNAIKDPFETNMGIHSPSTVFSGYGKHTVEGFNNGISGNQSSTQGVISTWVSNISSWFTNMMQIHSPSKLFEGFAGFTVAGFNNGISDGSQSTYDEIKKWSDGIRKSFSGIQEAPEVAYQFTRNITDNVKSNMAASVDYKSIGLESDIGREMKIAMSGAIDYEKLGEVIAYRLENADITAVLDSDSVYKGTVKKWRQEATRMQKNPVPIF